MECFVAVLFEDLFFLFTIVCHYRFINNLNHTRYSGSHR
jgi:hypothetical protein